MASDFIFANESQEPTPAGTAPSKTKWKLLIVDDEKEVHAVTRLALMDLTFEGAGLEFISAHSLVEAKAQIKQHPDLAIALLDVVMETDDAGLNVANFIRRDCNNQRTRIILRTGQPGQAPERAVVTNYDINDYKAKTELTSQKLFTSIMSALRSYRDIMQVEQQRTQLQQRLDQVMNLLKNNYPQAWHAVQQQQQEEDNT
ncbi:3'3'-cGAMP-specific phosphodiesterase 2 [Pseudidiomarina piscicola]|uniref:3'3'-cGAMP-specific phosphodiesterase 2 n=1 Tax=Pseudidiomarina piscicola TaxID=2614830 RepID=A0A6S6WKD1_9GAMM|nr:3'3'-cGAMP-specific phosphodiesterase 2 [Pseudidiomarina piscicola]VZT39090.1 3'3'-cGAMP-specific phosphodiesterase 2 [Pseudomonas aeruginosa]